jgi:putative ABC transport system permease protein
MHTRTRKIWADVLARKSRTALVSLSIAVGVFGVYLLAGLGDLILQQHVQDTPPQQIAMLKQLVVLPQGQLSLAENQAILAQLTQLPEVTAVEGQAFYPVAWHDSTPEVDEDGQTLYNDSNLLAFSQPLGQGQLEPVLRVIEGRYPNEGAGEIAVEVRFAERYGLHIGDSLTFRPAQPDGESRQWQIVGLVFHPFFSLTPARPGNLDPRESLFATYSDAQQITGFRGLSTIIVRYESFQAAQDHLRDFVDAVASQTPYVPVSNFLEDPADPFIIQNIENVVGVLTVLAILAMIVASFLVINVITAVVVEQKQQIGIMKSLGASRWNIFQIYAGMALVYGLIGTILGIVLAIPATAYLTTSLDTVAYTYIQGFPISPLALLLGAGLGLGMPVLVSIPPILTGTRVSILEAITDMGIASDWGQSWQARLITALPIPLTMQQALANIAQKKVRLALTGTTLTLAAASFMAVSAVLLTVNDQIANFYETLTYQIRINLADPHPYEAVAGLIQSEVRGIEALYPGYGIEVYLNRDPDAVGEDAFAVFLQGIDPSATIFNLELVRGDGWQNDPARPGVIISNPVAVDLDKTVGDTLSLTINNETRQVEIIGISDSINWEFYTLWQPLATWAGYSDPAGQALPNRIYIELEGQDHSIAAVEAKIGQVDRVLTANGIRAGYRNEPRQADADADILDIYALVFYIMAGVMATVGGIGLLVSLSMAVFERQKEIGVMRSIGASSRVILTQFLLEGLLIAVIAWAIALPFSYYLGRLLLGTIPFGGIFYRYPLVVMVYGLVGSLLIATVASVWPALSAARKTVSDILRYQ